MSNVATVRELTTVVVSVDQKHIKAGKKRNCTRCPISLAISEVLPPEKNRGVHVGIDVAFILNLNCYMDYNAELPTVAQDFIKVFDSHRDSHKAEPFSFELSIPKEFL